MLPPDIENLAILGWHLHPVWRFGRRACFTGAKDESTCDLNKLERWSAKWPGCGWRVHCGRSGLFAIDLDQKSDFHKADGITAFRELLGKLDVTLPPRPTIRTGGGGLVLIWKDPGIPLQGKSSFPEPGIDPKRGEQDFTVPPTEHHRTHLRYLWKVAPWNISPPDLPKELLEVFRIKCELEKSMEKKFQRSDKATGLLRAAFLAVSRAKPGNRNGALNAYAYYLGKAVREGRIEKTEVESTLLQAGAAAGLDRGEAQASFRSGFTKGMRSSP